MRPRSSSCAFVFEGSKRLIVIGIGDLLLRSDTDDEEDMPPFLARQMGLEDVVDQVLSLHRVHSTETLRSYHANDAVLITKVEFVWRREFLLQDSFEFSHG